MKRLGCLLAALLLLAVVVVALFPARMVWENWLKHQASQLELNGVSGSWWRGTAASSNFNGIELGKLSWSVFPRPITFQVEAEDIQVQARASHFSHPPPSIVFEPLSGIVDTRLIPQLLSDIHWQGEATLDFDRFQLIKNQQLSISGEALWQNARLTGNAAIELGEVVMQLSPEANSTLIKLHSVDGPDVYLDGNVLLSVESYEVSLRMRAKAGRTELQRQLQLLGKPNADGSVLMQFSGRF